MRTLTTDKVPYQAPPQTTAALLMAERENILSEWCERVNKAISSSKAEAEAIIIDTLPAFLENLAQALDPSYPRSVATEGTTVASEHGGERARVTRYAPGEVIREYQILRDVLLQSLSRAAPLPQDEADIIIKSVDQAMTESLNAYFLVHQGIREQFTIMMTHDLRNPLTAVKATADIILRFPDKTEQIPIMAARISENVRRIDRMIQDLLDASRVRFGEKIHFEVTEFELSSLVRETLGQLATIHGERFQFHGASARGYWNREAFGRAIENLVNNAVKYGDLQKAIEIRLETSHGRAMLSVRNEGSYIPPEEREGLFRSFMRAGSAQRGKERGWGLGLAMVRGMAEGHGGSVTVDSAPDRGTTFIIDVPLDSRPYLKDPLTPGA